MGHGFFDTSRTTSEVRFAPTTITFNRPDMALAVRALDWSLSASPEKAEALTHLGLSTPPPNLASPQSMTSRLYPLTDRCKEIALEASTESFVDPDLWLINAISDACGFDFNIATKENNKTVADKTDGSRHADILVHKQPHQTLYSVPVQHGPHFEFLNHRNSHQTTLDLDKRCEAHIQQQIAHARVEAPQLIRAIEATKNQLLTELSEAEIDALYLESLRQPLPYGYPSISYNSPIEAKATQIAQLSIYQDRLENSSRADASNGPQV